jgi:SAM-dependent methyltransferase
MLKYLKDSLRQQFADWRKALGAWRRFWSRYRRYRELAPSDRQPSLEHLYPCLGDDSGETKIGAIYFYQDTWAFEKIVRRHPEFHVDIGSHHKFVALLSKVVPVTMVDIRPLSLDLDTLQFREGSILDLPFEENSLPSVSSLCVVEHIGLGRYGDALDPLGSEKAIKELKRVLAPGGYFYLSVPVGDYNITAFDAGRIFDMNYLLELLHPLEVVDKHFIVGRSFQRLYEYNSPFGTTGLFELRKQAAGGNDAC